MINSQFTNMKIAAIASTVPVTQIFNRDFAPVFGTDKIEKTVATTGIVSSYACSENQTVSDLAHAAARNILESFSVDPAAIGALLYACPQPDYLSPSTAFVLHKRLELPLDCIAYDINLGCSGFVVGLNALCSTMLCNQIEYGLLIVGDSPSKSFSPEDPSRLLFGDAASAILVQQTAQEQPALRFALRSDGSRFKAIMVNAGGARMRTASLERTLWHDDVLRNQYDTYLNGTDVFTFTITDVPALINEFMQHYSCSEADFDSLLLHQANLYVLKQVAKRAKFPFDKVPLSLDRYANSSGSTIPVTICDAYASEDPHSVRALACGFGIGLSWGVADITFDTSIVLPITQTNAFFDDAFIQP